MNKSRKEKKKVSVYPEETLRLMMEEEAEDDIHSKSSIWIEAAVVYLQLKQEDPNQVFQLLLKGKDLLKRKRKARRTKKELEMSE
jgi:hypothetical protein